ncbi:hypothetical protein PNK_1967 [Candidatus Protochlamydia naegleriophila]|uniref:Uncharacterized protein n=1 Tax=Candidatus Protochlamydia naegleriophila TaxID=389348 RepID=A0A0U5ETI2_9BACT|nr:hypothetical protein [Candidatus Protochlamydia naegleriophila]CUI17571.1 hypothetical protein PNK_1967 [Candidatus Protochlamydia naegleriophila]
MVGILNTVRSTINYSLDASFQTASRIVSTPGSAKKVLDFADKIIAGCNYYSGTSYCPELVRSMKGTTDLINLFNTAKNGMFWLNPFTKDSIDQAHFQKTLIQSLPQDVKLAQPELANRLVNEVFKGPQAYYCQADVFDALKQSLVGHGMSDEEAGYIVGRVEITQKSRPILQLLSTSCFTLVGVVGNIRTLQKWGLLDGAKMAEMGQQAASIGSQSKVFTTVMHFGVDQVLGVIATIGTSVSLVDAIIKSVKAKQTLDDAESREQCEKAQAAMTKALWDLGTTGLDLMALAVPLFFAVSPPVAITLGIVSKGTGLFKIIYFG